MKLTLRSLHRDLGYLYVGLIIAFALSGIFLNHRAQFNASEYTYDVKPAQAALPQDPEQINDEWVKGQGKTWGMNEEPRGWRKRDGKLRVVYSNDRFEIDLKTGRGERESFRKIPLIAQTMQLHTDTSNWWIYYSDVFGLAMLTIAITGMFMQKGSGSFKKRGWKLALLGILFPLIFLFFLS